MLTNLVSNALRYVGSNGRIQLKAHRVGPNVHLSVQDNGPGIPQAYQSKIFQKFVQVKGQEAMGADAVLAITPNDQDNLVIGQLASLKFGVPRAIALANDPDNTEIFEKLGVSAFWTTQIVGSLIEQRASLERILNMLPERSACATCQAVGPSGLDHLYRLCHGRLSCLLGGGDVTFRCGEPCVCRRFHITTITLEPKDQVNLQLKRLFPYLHYSQIDSRNEMTVCGAYLDRMVLGGQRLHEICETQEHLQCEYSLNPRCSS